MEKYKETDELLDMYNLSNLGYNWVNNLNRSITANEIEVVIVKSPNWKKKKSIGPVDFSNILPDFQLITPKLLKLFCKTKERTFPQSFHEASGIQQSKEKEKYRPISLINRHKI